MFSKKRIKILATIGPSLTSAPKIKEAIMAGVNVFRINFSHGNQKDYKNIISNIKKISYQLKKPIAILQDLQGPKIRVGKFKDDFIKLNKNETINITYQNTLGDQKNIPCDFPGFHKVCQKGTKILLDDGLIELKVLKVINKKVIAKVIYGGILKNRKGINIPGVNLPINPLTKKDLNDLNFGLKNDVDYVALSFVRSANDIKKLQNIINKKKSSTKIIAKIEMLKALEDLENIIELSDGIMVARGDLAIEIGDAHLPGIQKNIISLCNKKGKPVIVATQMLESMVQNPKPTRAEITDVANAVLDGSDALMLSAETASGKYPIRCIQTMNEIALEAEKNAKFYYHLPIDPSPPIPSNNLNHYSNSLSLKSNNLNPDNFTDTTEAISACACLCALKLQAKVICCFTASGQTAINVSKFRPTAKIIALTSDIKVLNKLELAWGVNTFIIDFVFNIEDLIKYVEKLLLKWKFAQIGDNVIYTFGMPLKKVGSTNAIKVDKIEKK